MTLNYGVTLLDATYGDFLNTNGLEPQLGATTRRQLFVQCSKSLLTLDLTIQTFSHQDLLTYRANAAYKSKIYFSEFNEYSQDAYTIVDLNLIWESADETFRSRFFIKNATDEEYISGYLSSATGGGRFSQWGYPRTAGIEIQRNF